MKLNSVKGKKKPKVNCDGALTIDNLAGSGGVVRNFRGESVSGYSMRMGRCNTLQAELWAIKEGLRLAWDQGCRDVWVELENDSAVAVRI